MHYEDPQKPGEEINIGWGFLAPIGTGLLLGVLSAQFIETMWIRAAISIGLPTVAYLAYIRFKKTKSENQS